VECVEKMRRYGHVPKSWRANNYQPNPVSSIGGMAYLDHYSSCYHPSELLHCRWILAVDHCCTAVTESKRKLDSFTRQLHRPLSVETYAIPTIEQLCQKIESPARSQTWFKQIMVALGYYRSHGKSPSHAGLA